MIETLPPEVANALEKELRLGWELKKEQCKARQGALGKSSQQAVKSVEGLGALVGRIDAESYHYWGQRETYDCWKDKQFFDEYLRDNPQARVKSGGTRIQVGYGN